MFFCSCDKCFFLFYFSFLSLFSYIKFSIVITILSVFLLKKVFHSLVFQYAFAIFLLSFINKNYSASFLFIFSLCSKFFSLLICISLLSGKRNIFIFKIKIVFIREFKFLIYFNIFYSKIFIQKIFVFCIYIIQYLDLSFISFINYRYVRYM